MGKNLNEPVQLARGARDFFIFFFRVLASPVCDNNGRCELKLYFPKKMHVINSEARARFCDGDCDFYLLLRKRKCEVVGCSIHTLPYPDKAPEMINIYVTRVYCHIHKRTR